VFGQGRTKYEGFRTFSDKKNGLYWLQLAFLGFVRTVRTQKALSELFHANFLDMTVKTVVKSDFVLSDLWRYGKRFEPFTIWVTDKAEYFIIIDYTPAVDMDGWASVIMMNLKDEKKYEVSAETIFHRVETGILQKKIR
jgi:hypothetical protein